jgi:Protein of unknown function (DUF2510)/zinc-ribbon family
MIIIFGLRRLRKGLGPVMLRCSNCGMSPLVLFRVSTWFALFFIPIIPVSFKHFTACGNCKRVAQVSKTEVENARAQEEAMKTGGASAPTVVASQPATLEHAVNEWAAVGGPGQTAPPQWPGSPAESTSSFLQASPPPQAPPGWFPDPRDPSANRYWDGQQWTEHTTPKP